jgi:CheY-like chemotaxis protein
MRFMINLKKMTVLIADDSPNMCQSISGMMKVLEFGKRLISVNNGKEAWDILREQSVDLLLLDYNMPIMTGSEVLSQIRMDRDLRDLPVIMITAEAYQDYVAEIGESEIDAYILKPLTIKVLEEKVNLVINKANNPPPMIKCLKMARKCEESGDYETAITLAQKAIKENPKSTRPVRELGYYYLKNGDLDSAEKYLKVAAKKNYLDVFAFDKLGELYLKRNDTDSATKYFFKAMAVSPRQIGRGVRLGKLLIKKNNFDKAQEVFKKVFSLPSSTPELQEEVADFCIDKGCNDYAKKLLEDLADDFPERGDLLFKLGKFLLGEGEKIRAITFLAKAASIDKLNIEIRLELGRLYLEMNKPLLAEKPLLQILHINKNHKEAQALLKRCT